MSAEPENWARPEADYAYRPRQRSNAAAELIGGLPQLIAAFIGAVIETLTTPGMRTSEGLMALGLFGAAGYIHATDGKWPPDTVLLGIVAVYGFYALARALCKSGRGGE